MERLFTALTDEQEEQFRNMLMRLHTVFSVSYKTVNCGIPDMSHYIPTYLHFPQEARLSVKIKPLHWTVSIDGSFWPLNCLELCQNKKRMGQFATDFTVLDEQDNSFGPSIQYIFVSLIAKQSFPCG